jgi:hypothetical protein
MVMNDVFAYSTSHGFQSEMLVAETAFLVNTHVYFAHKQYGGSRRLKTKIYDYVFAAKQTVYGLDYVIHNVAGPSVCGRAGTGGTVLQAAASPMSSIIFKDSLL